MSGSDNNIVTEVFNFNIYAYCLSTNRVTLVGYIAQTVYVLHYWNQLFEQLKVEFYFFLISVDI